MQVPRWCFRRIQGTRAGSPPIAFTLCRVPRSLNTYIFFWGLDGVQNSRADFCLQVCGDAAFKLRATQKPDDKIVGWAHKVCRQVVSTPFFAAVTTPTFVLCSFFLFLLGWLVRRPLFLPRAVRPHPLGRGARRPVLRAEPVPPERRALPSKRARACVHGAVQDPAGGEGGKSLTRPGFLPILENSVLRREANPGKQTWSCWMLWLVALSSV